MDSVGDIIPFAKEMVNQRPSKCLLKVYVLGSSLAMLGAVGGVVETLLQAFSEQERVEDPPAGRIMGGKIKNEKKKTKMTLTSTTVHPETSATAKAVLLRGTANRSHAS